MKEEFKVDTNEINEKLSEHYNHEEIVQKKHTFANTIIILLIIIVGAGFFVVDKYNIDVIDILGLKKTESAIDNRPYKEDEQYKTTSTTTTTTTTSTTTRITSTTIHTTTIPITTSLYNN